MYCSACGTANPAQARFCLGCGRTMIRGLVCTSCHTLLPAHSRYCFHCGLMVNMPWGLCANCGAGLAPGQPACGFCGAAAAQPGMQQPLPPAQIQFLPPAPQAYPVQPPAPMPFQAPQQPHQPGHFQGTGAPLQQPGAFPVPQPAQPYAAPTPTPGAWGGQAASVPATGGSAVRLPPARPLGELLGSLQHYLPRHLYEPLERRPTERNLQQVRDHLTGLLRTAKTYLPRPVVLNPQPAGEPAGGIFQGTFLFVDVSGFTPLSERLSRLGLEGAERVTDIINSLFYDLVSVLFDHGGVLLKFGGDALLGLFEGQNDAEMAAGAVRAVQAAMAMQRVMGKFSAIEAAGQTSALRIKCGISSGRYFAAHIGTKHNMAYVTTGHTVNRAEQAEEHAQPGDVVMAQATLDLIGAQAAVEPRGDDFYLVQHIAPAEGSFAQSLNDELPAADLQTQLTYLVERMDRLAPYLAGELLPRIANNPENVGMPPDHRPVTVMFVNYVGISDLIEDLGDSQPELITQQLNNYFVEMARVVERYEGVVGRMDQYSIGDRLVIFFGAPRAHEDDPVRAVYTALDMQEATRKNFSALQTPSGIYRFQQRIGINTGHLFAGNVGAANLRQEYTLMGDDINMAARLMSKAGWRQVFISRKTQERVAAFFELKDEGSLKVKGKEILIPTYQVLGRREEIGQTRGLAGGESPYTGRENEYQQVLTCGESLLHGRGQIVSIIGDSGLGKSRLKREFRRRIYEMAGDRPLRWLEGQALSFSEQVSYWLTLQVMHGALELKSDASENDLLFSLWEKGETLLGKEMAREVIPFLAPLLGITLEGEWAKWVKELDPKVRQKQTFWAAREFFTALARQQPTIIVLDDLHWADETSLALFENLLEVTDRAPLMFLLVFRLRRDKGCWQLRDGASGSFPHRYTEVQLRPLNEEHSRELLGKLLPGANLSAKITEDIILKAAGNPFYLEEVVRTLIDSSAVVPDPEQEGLWKVTANVQEIAVPTTLQGAIISRIDRLTEDSRKALQMASVIGRRFETELLKSLAGTGASLDAWLSQLERSDLVRPAKQANGDAYDFPDTLVQEVAYASLLVQQRQEFHRRIAASLEEVHANRTTKPIDLICYHLMRSNTPQQAIHYLEAAGRKAQDDHANETAIGYYSDLLTLLDGEGAPWEHRFTILELRQSVYAMIGAQDRRQADLEAMLTLAEEHSDPHRRVVALNGLADLYQWTGRYNESEAAARRALALAGELGDTVGEATALHSMAVIYYYKGDYEEARPKLERAATLRQASNDAAGEETSLMYLGMIHFFQGNYQQATTYHTNAYQAADARQDSYHMGIHLTNDARVAIRMGSYEQALKEAKESLELKERVGNRIGVAFSIYVMGQAYAYLERYDEATSALMEALTIRQEVNDERGIAYCHFGLGQVALAQHEYDKAIDHFNTAITFCRRLGLKAEMITNLSYLGRALLGIGERDQALAASTEAMALLQEHPTVEEVQQIYFNHYQVLAAHHSPDAKETLQQAHALVEQFAERISDPERQAIFLNNVRVNREIQAAMAALT